MWSLYRVLFVFTNLAHVYVPYLYVILVPKLPGDRSDVLIDFLARTSREETIP